MQNLFFTFLSWLPRWYSRMNNCGNLWTMCSFIGNLQTDFVKYNIGARSIVTLNQTREQRVHSRHIIGRHHDYFIKN